MVLREPIIQHRDVTGALLHFSQAQIAALVEAMPPEQRSFAKLLASAIKTPQEIWQAWGADPSNPGGWVQIRTYLHIYDLAEHVPGVYCAALVRFVYRTRWEMDSNGLITGRLDEVTERLVSYRTGRIEYSNDQH